ncbi:hypothetical protein [Limnoglobus roseus]|uniref:Uncharacterized protein n=1 Tax=Limnoglobus roseus TaxID=2598579 RepID=A0A5C1AIS5_9BACT|nr:hypothetical protein [Limnoglobus roseus]QEL19339.1 hypothetical protein PX52LOC_06408 [Limnoglobus roseus]
MTTGNAIVTGALRSATTIMPGEGIDGGEAESALAVLNAMLAAWSADGLTPAFHTLEGFPLVVNQANYTVGTGGNFNTVRPDEVCAVFRRDANGYDTPLNPWTREQWLADGLKSNQGTPTFWYYDPQYPLGVLRLDNAPTLAETIYLDTLKPINQFATLSSTMLMPGEYEEAMKYKLVERLAPEYGFPISQDLRVLITESFKRIKRKNSKPVRATFDPALRGSVPFNINNG